MKSVILEAIGNLFGENMKYLFFVKARGLKLMKIRRENRSEEKI
jgi:hypothetical protein